MTDARADAQIKVLTIFGTRPEAIKMAPLVKELEKHPDQIRSVVCVTAQHRQMLDQVLAIFDVHPDYDLDIMQQRQTLTGVAIRALEGLEQVISNEKPDIVLVHGDTLTTFVGSLAAFYHQTKVGHVEAGLRTYDKYSPFPEEMNRKLTGAIADLHFAPTETSKKNLLAENIRPETIIVTGNTEIDALRTTVKPGYRFANPLLQTLGEKRRLIAATAHRRENLGEPMVQIAEAMRRIVEEHEDVELCYPVHLNPAVRDVVFPILSGHERIHLIDPLDVNEMHNLLARSYLVLTDSGGIQEAAPSLGTPVLVLRDVTERPEAVAAGTVRVVGTDTETIVSTAHELLTNHAAHDKMAHAVNPYGDGEASRRIVQALLHHFGLSDQPVDEFRPESHASRGC